MFNYTYHRSRLASANLIPSFDECQRGSDLLTLRNVHKARFSVDMLLLADYAAWVVRVTGLGGETTLLGLDTDFSLVRDTSPCARLNRVVDRQDVLARSGMNRGIV